MNIVNSIKNYFTSKSTGNTTKKAPEGICPNCWGKQEWEGEFYKKIKTGTPNDKTYENFINDVAIKLDKITLKKDILVCETCKMSSKQ
jgi:hypothetical protein